MPSDPGNPHARGHHAGEAATEDVVDRLVRAGTSIELHEYRRGHADRLVPPLGGT
jgi:hypothetical protein